MIKRNLKIILRLLRLTADLSNENLKKYHTSLFIYDKNLSPVTIIFITTHIVN
jgi:hypothetical protein